MTLMKHILIISFSPIERDPRVVRQVQLLENKYKLSVVGFDKFYNKNVEYIQLDALKVRSRFRKIISALKLLLGLFEQHYSNLFQVVDVKSKLKGKRYDLILVNDVLALPVALTIGKSAKILLDAHEYTPREFEDRFVWRLFFSRYYHYLCKKYLPEIDGMLTVCQGIAEEYKAVYKVDAKVIHNAPIRKNLLPSPVENSKIRLIHHGIATPSRNLELMIEMTALLDQRFSLDLMLVETDSAYMRKLKLMIGKNSKVNFVKPVPMQEICNVINNYDVGVFLLPPVNFNYKHALPNKFFEFIQARLAIAIGPSPEMARLVNKYSCGIVAKNFTKEALADSLNALTEGQVQRYKAASHLAASELHYGTDAEVLLSEIEKLL